MSYEKGRGGCWGEVRWGRGGGGGGGEGWGGGGGGTQPRVTISISREIADSILQNSCSNQIMSRTFEFTSPSEDSFLIFSSSNKALQDELQKLGYTRSSVTLSVAQKEKPESLVDHLGDRCTSTTSDNTRKEHAVSERVKQIKG